MIIFLTSRDSTTAKKQHVKYDEYQEDHDLCLNQLAITRLIIKKLDCFSIVVFHLLMIWFLDHIDSYAS